MMSIRQLIFLPALLLVVATRFFGTCVPSTVGENVSLVIAGVVGVISVVVEYTLPANKIDPEWGSRDSFGMLRGMSYFPGFSAILRVVLAPVFGYLVFSQSLPWLYNMQFGNRGSQVEVVSGYSVRNGVSCPQFDDVLFVYSGALCKYGQTLAIGTAVTIEGLSSVWGINAD